ncbi:hypothetical protein AZE42_09270 [Rhizopogon vesiculosus]|uniref:DUF6533 domain-containing protein n=1 Tax=Rhizopogon vesiculosus TaxID=180088 RepID=A0A1J8PVS3_9AGAM|nr:hypothetical protein AZE42_09270 [Rhizopogon vesiculosus]
MVNPAYWGQSAHLELARPHTYFMVFMHTEQTIKVRAHDVRSSIPSKLWCFVTVLSRFVVDPIHYFPFSTAITVAPAAVWAFDYCLTFEHEVYLFTSISRWSITTVMFIIARYSPIVWIISDIYVLNIKQDCWGFPDSYLAGYRSSALFELTAIAVTLYHSLRPPTSMRAVSKLASTLRKGSLLYALSLLAISVANIVTLSLALSDGQNGVLDVFQGVLHGVLASRILFELRAQATDRGGELDVEDTYVPSSGLRFASERIPMAPLSYK